MNCETKALSKIRLLQIFKTKFLEFLKSLHEIFPEETDLVIIQVLFENQIPIEESMCVFAKRILSCAKMVRDRNESFFLEENSLFMGIKTQRVVSWKNMWKSSRLSNDDKESMWKWFDLFLSLADMYHANYM